MAFCLILPAFGFTKIDECVVLNSSSSIQEICSFVYDDENLVEINASRSSFSEFLELKKDFFLEKLREKFLERVPQTLDRDYVLQNLPEFSFITYDDVGAFSIAIKYEKNDIWNYFCKDEGKVVSTYGDGKVVYEVFRLNHTKFSKVKVDGSETLIMTSEYLKNLVFQTLSANFNVTENFIKDSNLTYTISVPYGRYHSNADEIQKVGSLWCHTWNVEDFGEKEISVWTTHANNGVWYGIALTFIVIFGLAWFLITKKLDDKKENCQDEEEVKNIDLINF